MQKRSLPKLILYFVLTLGIYELIWIVQTRKELIALTGVNIPKALYIVATRVLGIIISLLLIYLVFVWLGPNSSSQPSSISSGCWSQYTIAGAPQDVNSSTAISATCKQEITQYYQSDAEQTNQYKLYGLVIVLGIFFLWAYLQWFKYYAVATEKATNGRLSSVTTMLIIGFLPYGISMLVIQDAFNTQSNTPEDKVADETLSSVNKSLSGHGLASKDTPMNILKGIGIGIAILIALIILFQQLILS